MLVSSQNRGASAKLFDLATVLALVSALIYATGWSYAYYYFGHFKLGLLVIDIPNHYFFIYGFWVLKAWWWLVALIYLLFIFAILQFKRLCASEGRRQARLFKHAQIWGLLLAFLLMWWLALKQAESYYTEQQHQGFSAYPLTRVWLKTPAPDNKKLLKIHQELPTGRYRLLLGNKEKLFLFKLPGDGKPTRPAILQINLSEVRAVKLLP